MNESKIRVAITQGDANGIGYELIMKAFDDPVMFELLTPVVYGEQKVAAFHKKSLGSETLFTLIGNTSKLFDSKLNFISSGDSIRQPALAEASRESVASGRLALDKALADYREGGFDALVNMPMPDVEGGGYGPFDRYLCRALDEAVQPIRLFLSGSLRIAAVVDEGVTGDASPSLTSDEIVRCATTLHTTLRRDFRISIPRIAVLSVNPEGEEGFNSTEEKDIILPAIDTLMAAGIKAFGPYSAERFLGSDMLQRFDCVLAMTSEQRKTVFEALAVEPSVVYEAGLGIVAVTPLIDVADAVAHRGELTPDDLRQALYTAVDIFRNRCSYDEPMQHPLPKLYHEKRDDSEKVRFRSHNA